MIKKIRHKNKKEEKFENALQCSISFKIDENGNVHIYRK